MWSVGQVDRGADDWDETKHIKAGRTVTKADVTETPVTKTDVTETADNGNDGGVLPDRPEGRSRPRYSNASANLEWLPRICAEQINRGADDWPR